MHTVAYEGPAETGPEIGSETGPETGAEPPVDLLIEKGFLLLGSIEFQIEEHLMSHGIRIDPETRLFMAQVRDAAGDAAAKMLHEARNRLDAAPADSSAEPAEAEAGDEARPGAPLLPGEGRAPRSTRGSYGGRAVGFGRAATRIGLGTASAAVIFALLLAWRAPSGAPAIAADDAAPVMEIAAVDGQAGKTDDVLVEEVTQRTRPDRGEQKATVDQASKAAADSVETESRVTYPNLLAAAWDARSAAARRPLDVALADFALRSAELGDHPAYPDPRAGPAGSGASPAGSPATAADEAQLALSAGARREVQQRLALARFDPQHFDGIFGPATRAALAEWQSSAGFPATGYLDASALARLRERTADAYATAQAAKKPRASKKAAHIVLRSPVPPVSPLRADGCSRTRNGEIVYGRGVRCDFRGLKQSIAKLFG